ncbi:MAG: hypothetical protein K6G13_08370 [Agathobacter sp.]|uniref:hypothetical protein n=1 Tax=Agathobacter sp. TaxID=2021311 RepID=UPI0025904BC7|nr:hypothetical protein [Agathobacter sp.]MCR5678028.1 hypothetical protein [Agathobacter sp.]
MRIFCTKINNYSGINERKQEIINHAAQNLGYQTISLFKFPDQVDSDQELMYRMFGIFAAFDQDDVLFFQYPSMVSLRYDNAVMNQMARYQNATKIVIVEDFGSRIDPEHYPSLDDEVNLLNQADLLILQGNEMLEELKQHGLNGVHVILQKVWDYPLNEEPNGNDVKVKDGFGILAGPNNLNPLYMGYYIRNNLPVIALQGTPGAEFVEKFQVGLCVTDEQMQQLDIQSLVMSTPREQLEQILKKTAAMAPLMEEGAYSKTLLMHALVAAQELKIKKIK